MSATLIGKLVNVMGAGVAEVGSVAIALCGYGSQVPIVPGSGVIARITTLDVEADSNGDIEAELWGNDKILPAGTYYTVTVKDSNGDVMQINAYLFMDGHSYDLDSLIPFDPSQPPSPLPPLIIPQLLILAGNNSNPVFPGDVYTAFKIVLTLDASATIQSMVPGNLYTFIVGQDATGGHRFTWPANVHNGSAADPEPNSTTTQTFVADENGALWAIGPGMWV